MNWRNFNASRVRREKTRLSKIIGGGTCRLAQAQSTNAYRICCFTVRGKIGDPGRSREDYNCDGISTRSRDGASPQIQIVTVVSLGELEICRRNAAGGVVECTWITGKYVIMSAAQFIHELEAMSKSERESIFASLVENQEWREDLFDLMTIADRRNEPVRPIDEVFSDLKIDA